MIQAFLAKRKIKKAVKMAAKQSPLEFQNGIVKQWVSRVTAYSSQYDSVNWGNQMVVGAPKVYPRYGDHPGAWAPGGIDDGQFLELEFEEAVFITKVDIYETYHAGGIKSIQAKDKAGKWVEIYGVDQVTNHTTSRIFSPQLKELGCPTREIRLNIDCTACGTWVEIDAVQLYGNLYRPEAPPPMSVLADNLQTMVDNQQFSDVAFLVEGTTVYAHKVILCARSEYFRAMFRENTRESSNTIDEPIELKDVNLNGFKSVLHYLYTNNMPTGTPCEGLPDICRVADQFSIEGLKLLAAFKVNEMLDETNVIDTYVSASSKIPELEDIKENCLLFISGSMATVVRTQAFERLPQDLMLEIVQHSTSRLSINK